MDDQFTSCIPFNSINNDPNQSIHYLQTMPYEELHTTQSPNTMSGLGDINYLAPAGPISTYNYASLPGIEQEPAIQQVVMLNNSTTIPLRNNSYHHHHPQTLMPNTGLLYDGNHSFHDEGWMQFSLSTTNNANNGLETPNQQIPSSSSPPMDSTTSKKCEWKGCTFLRPFRRDAELMRHIKTVHVSRDAYKCPVCGKAFGRKDKMEDHRRIHTHTIHTTRHTQT